MLPGSTPAAGGLGATMRLPSAVHRVSYSYHQSYLYFKNTNSGEFFHPGFVGTQGEVGVGDRVSLWGCPQWGLPALRSDCPGSPRFCSPLWHGGASSPDPVGALAVPRSPGHVWSPGGKHVPALEELLFVGGHEAGPLVPAERLAQRARAPLRVTRPGHGGARPVCLLISALPSRP